MKTSAKSAFTILELLVVIGIIGILMGVALTQFGGSTESAKAAKCETNMRNLVTAAHTCALEQKDGYFPAAGSFIYQWVNHVTVEMEDHKRVGWIAGSERSNGGTSPFVPVAFNGDETAVTHALTNGNAGAMWKATNRSRETYLCPVHASAARKANGRTPGWSYVMNCWFGYEKGSKDKDSKQNFWGQTADGLWTPKGGTGGNVTRDASRLLMFAELQGADFDAPGYTAIKANTYLKAGVPGGDAILEYEKGENIGFNHKLSNRGITGHVAFTDGHVERLFYPKSGGSVPVLTKALCLGHEVSFDGKEYVDLQPNN